MSRNARDIFSWCYFKFMSSRISFSISKKDWNKTLSYPLWGVILLGCISLLPSIPLVNLWISNPMIHILGDGLVFLLLLSFINYFLIDFFSLFKSHANEHNYATMPVKPPRVFSVKLEKKYDTLWGNLRLLLLTLKECQDNDIILSNAEKIQKYADIKIEFLNLKESLLFLMAHDISDKNTSPLEIEKITEYINSCRTLLEGLTNLLLEITPWDAIEVYNFPEPWILRDTIFEENSWIEWEANSLIALIHTWITSLQHEVELEKVRLRLLLWKQETDIWNLLKATEKIKNESFEKVLIQSN